MKIMESIKFGSFLHRPNRGSNISWVYNPSLRTSIYAAVLGAVGVVLIGKARKYIVFSVSDQELASSRGSWVVPGLQNLGNNCFLNVILQALASCSSFRKYVKEISEEYELLLSDEADDNLPLVCSLASLVEGLNMVRQRSSVLSPRRLMLAMDHYIPNFNLTKQQDAEEAFSHLLTSLREEISEHFVPNRTCLANLPSLGNRRIVATKSPDEESVWQKWRRSFLKPFDGILGSVLICQSCSFQISLDFQLFHSLHLSPPTSGASTIIGGCTLDHCLKKFFLAEYIENYQCSNCWHTAAIKYVSAFAEDKRDIEKLQRCNKYDSCDCKDLSSLEALRWSNKFSRTLKQLTLAQTPKILCIHLQRASYNMFGQSVKVLGHVSFPLILDLSPFVCVGVGLNNMESNSRFRPLKSTDTGLSLLNSGAWTECNVDTISQLPPSVHHQSYRLVSVVVHYGTSGGGHYTVYRKVTAKIGEDDPASLLESSVEQWFCISDSEVCSVYEKEVLDANATMLFYEKID